MVEAVFWYRGMDGYSEADGYGNSKIWREMLVQSTSSRVRWFKSKSGNRQMDRWMKEQKDGWTRVIALP